MDRKNHRCPFLRHSLSSMRIEPTLQLGLPPPALLGAFDGICGAVGTNELLFELAKWTDMNFEEPVS